MASMGVELLGFFLGLLGFTGTVVATVLPQWWSTAFVGSNIMSVTAYIKGLWMECVWHSTGIYQCQLYRSMLALPPDMQACRALMVVSCLSSVVASVIAATGMKCTRFVQRSQVKSRLVLSGGICFLCAAFLCLVTVCWTTYSVVMQFYDPFLPGGVKYEIGLSVYLGFASTCLSLTAGLVLCWSSRGVDSRRRPPSVPPSANRHAPAPLYGSPDTLKDNHTPPFCCFSNSGYNLDNYF
ncbi:Claudin-14 [Oryzias melastigma]|uniref:Claudin n=1 Tax=Oryzias melastigma TaxID=30732 RepID=A0A3B3CTQ9_ORYME|nr:claudin-14 [Oryzias melastigma]KAF6738674.1 Claudin-14 [Oryzias melastigma]